MVKIYINIFIYGNDFNNKLCQGSFMITPFSY